jgi:hypothetical protein
MQNAGDAALAAAVDSFDRYVVYRVEIDWNRNGLYTHTYSDMTSVVGTLTVNRDIDSSLPPQVTLVEGFYSAQMQVSLAGRRPQDTETVGVLFSMWRSDSPLYGKTKVGTPIRAYIGHRVASGAETLVRQFTGVITECKVDSSGAVSLVCSDSDNTGPKIDLPQFAAQLRNQTYTGEDLALKQNSQWVIDYALRRSGYFMSPPTHARTFFAATLHGGMAAEVGHSGYNWLNGGGLTEEDAPYSPGRPGWGLAWGGIGQSWYSVASYRGDFTDFVATTGQSICFQMQVNADYANRQYSVNAGMLVQYNCGPDFLTGTSIFVRMNSSRQIIVEFYNNGVLALATTGPTMGTGWQDLWVEIDIGVLLSNSTIRYPGMTSAINLGGLAAQPPTLLYPSIQVYAMLPMHDLQISNMTGLASGTTRYDPATWVPQADLDKGLNDFLGIPLRRGVRAWDLIKEVAQVEYGLVGFNEAGVPFFRNRDTVRRSAVSPVKTIDETKVLSDMSVSERSGSVVNTVTANIAPTYIRDLFTQSYETIFSLKDITSILLPPGASVLVFISDVPTAYFDRTDLVQYSTTQWNDKDLASITNHGFVTRTAGGVEVTTGVTATLITPLSWRDTKIQDQIQIIFTNNNQAYLRFSTTDAQPALRIRGIPYHTSPNTAKTWTRASSVAANGERTFDLPDSDWRQMSTSSRKIATSLLRDLRTPVPTLDPVRAVGDCRIQLQDTAVLQDRTRIGGPVHAIITGIQRSLEVSGTGGARLIDQYNVRPVAAPGKWILGHPTWSVLGQTTKL